MHAHVLWSINRLFYFFSPRRQSLSAADQIAGRGAETALWKMDLGRSAQLFSIWGPPPHIHIRFKRRDVYCLWQRFTPLPEWADNDPSVWDKPSWVFSETPRFIARWRIQYLRLIQVWLPGGFCGSVSPSAANARCYFLSLSLSLPLMKIMVMNVFCAALWLSHQLFLLLSLRFNIALLILLIKKLIAFASLWSPFGASIWWRLLVVNFNEALSQRLICIIKPYKCFNCTGASLPPPLPPPHYPHHINTPFPPSSFHPHPLAALVSLWLRRTTGASFKWLQLNSSASVASANEAHLNSCGTRPDIWLSHLAWRTERFPN